MNTNRQVSQASPRAPEKELALRTAWANANRVVNPSPEEKRQRMLAWARRVIASLPVRPRDERVQYIALYQAKKDELGRGPRASYCDDMRAISRELWRERMRGESIARVNAEQSPWGAA